ncbi:hypothetical protein ACGC1H_000088 [Rhizoctonia solani]|uniref:Uncharacterized protein n=1 Tax=Rhizoctonia solani TaxID=456999 RepID=A0A8H3A3X6_9AGAM|nr:unnamed protein product [Rhizoctonia solani]
MLILGLLSLNRTTRATFEALSSVYHCDYHNSPNSYYSTMPTTHPSIYTSSLSSHISSPISPLSCSELAHIILTSFSKQSTEGRQLVSFILQSVHEYSAAGSISRGLIGDDDLKLVATWSDLLMAVASRLEVDLKNGAWTGDLLTDVRRMYNSIIIKLMGFFIKTAGDGVLLAINVLRSTLADTHHYLATSTTCTIERNIAITARKYNISYAQPVMITGNRISMSPRPVDEARVVKMKTGFKSTFKLRRLWKKKGGRGKYDNESECIESCETDSCAVSETEAGDSGVSMGGSDSDEDWGWEDEVGVAF